MNASSFQIATIKGDGIGVDVTDATIAVMEAAQNSVGGFVLEYDTINAGAGYYKETGLDIESDGEQRDRKSVV